MSKSREKTEREWLQELLRQFEAVGHQSEISLFHHTELVFGILEMEEFDQTKNKDLWKKFRKMLKNHPVFDNEWHRNHFKNHDGRKKYYWWRDPDNWK